MLPASVLLPVRRTRLWQAGHHLLRLSAVQLWQAGRTIQGSVPCPTSLILITVVRRATQQWWPCANDFV